MPLGADTCLSDGDWDAAITVCKRLLAKDELRAILLDLECRYPGGSALNSVWKLQEIVSRSSTASKIFWFLTKLDDELKTGSLPAETVTVKNIKGKHTKSISDMLFLKQSMKGLLLGQMPLGLNNITGVWIKTPPFTLARGGACKLALTRARLIKITLVSMGPDVYLPSSFHRALLQQTLEGLLIN